MTPLEPIRHIPEDFEDYEASYQAQIARAIDHADYLRDERKDRACEELRAQEEAAKTAPPKREMGMMEWYATEGGRKCPMCGRYAKPETLGDLSFWTAPPVMAHITLFGHLPGYGCNQSRDERVQP